MGFTAQAHQETAAPPPSLWLQMASPEEDGSASIRTFWLEFYSVEVETQQPSLFMSVGSSYDALVDPVRWVWWESSQHAPGSCIMTTVPHGC